MADGDVSRPRRKYLRVSVRGLIILVLSLGAGLGWMVRSARNLSGLRLVRTQITDAGLSHLKGLTHLRNLRLDATDVTDAGVKDLKNNETRSRRSRFDVVIFLNSANWRGGNVLRSDSLG
jgi:hypothetical protein